MRAGRALVIALALLGAACTSTPGPSTTTASGPSTSTSTTFAPSTTSTTGTSQGPVVGQLEWFLGLLNGDAFDPASYEDRVTGEFLAQVDPVAFEAVIEQLRAASEIWEVTSFEDRSETSARALIAPPGGAPALRVVIDVEADPPHRISTLFVQPAETPALDDPPESLDEAAARLTELGTLHMLAAEIVDGRCAPLYVVAGGEPAPIASVVKLYVLGALADAVAAGEVSWQDELTIRDELKAPPTGILQDRPDGSTVTVEEAASLMISISDNTATDHLVDLLGRRRIEESLTAWGSTTPDRNTPFLTTRELTALKVGPGSGLREQYLAGSESERRAILDQISGLTPGDIPVYGWTEPIDPDRLEWFASPEDLCALHVLLDERSGDDETVRRVLTANPGVPDEEGRWEHVAFKGGSEPGLLAMTWLVRDAAGRTFVLAGSVVNPAMAFDDTEAALLFGAARDLMEVGG